MEEKLTVKMLTCRGCNRTYRHGLWIYMSGYQKELMVRYYNVQWDKVLCDLCKQKILDGVPI